MDVTLHYSFGQRVVVTIDPGATVLDLLDLAREKVSGSTCLLFGDELLNPELPLSDTGLTADGEVLVLTGLSPEDLKTCLEKIWVPNTTLASLEKEFPGAASHPEVALVWLGLSHSNIEDIHPSLWGCSSFVTEAVAKHPKALAFAAPRLREERSIVLRAVGYSGLALEHAAENLRNDKPVVIRAVESHGSALEYASERLQGDQDVVLAAVEKDGDALRYASQQMKADRGVVMAAVCSYGLALEHASCELQDDKEIVMAAVGNRPNALVHASLRLRGNRTIVLCAMQRSSLALVYAAPSCWKAVKLLLGSLTQPPPLSDTYRRCFWSDLTG
eukprot:Sspe_Gene.69030::Locus_40681_Transcript_1_1_Confidence_1.000_Length_1128::g.69030::m.69030